MLFVLKMECYGNANGVPAFCRCCWLMCYVLASLCHVRLRTARLCPGRLFVDTVLQVAWAAARQRAAGRSACRRDLSAIATLMIAEGRR